MIEHKPVLTIYENISKILNDEDENLDTSKFLEGYSIDDLVYFKFAPIKLVDVERSFLSFKTLLADNRRSF